MTDKPSTDKLDELHERVNAMLEVPVPKESEAWTLPLEQEQIIDTKGAGYEPQPPDAQKSPAES